MELSETSSVQNIFKKLVRETSILVDVLCESHRNMMDVILPDVFWNSSSSCCW